MAVPVVSDELWALWTEVRATPRYERYRSGRMVDGRRFSRPPNPYTPPATPQGEINVRDPDCAVVKGSRGRGFVQGYGAQAVANKHQIVIVAEVMTVAPDVGHLEPMLDAAQRELDAAGVSDVPEVLLADAGYWHHQQMERLSTAASNAIPPDAKSRKGTRPGGNGGLYAFMRRVLATDRGAELYGQRQTMVEPVIANAKFNRASTASGRRGRAAVRAEWRLITAAHNLLELPPKRPHGRLSCRPRRHRRAGRPNTCDEAAGG